MNPYILQGQPMQDVSGLQPVFQNFAQQQANQQAALAQQMGNTQQAGMVGQQDGSMNGMAMAAMLRKGQNPTQNQLNAQDAQMGGLGTYNPLTQYEISNTYGTTPYSQQSRMLASQEF